MKILFFARALGPGGAERQMALLAAGLQRRGHDVTVATFYPGGQFAPVVVGSGARHICLEKCGRWDVVGFALRFRRLLFQERPEILYSLLPPANIVAACLARFRGRPRRVWGIRVSEMRLGHYDWLQRLSYFAERRLAPTADLIIFNSQCGLTMARARGFAAGNCAVVQNGIDTSLFFPDKASRRNCRAAWRVAEDETLIGMIGRFDPMKDHRTFLEAAGSMSRPKLRFVLAGVGVESANAQLMGMVRAAGLAERVLLLGERTDMPAIMAALDILCLSSAFGEGFPNVLGEAMAAGTPCVATDVGDSRDVVGDTGVIVPPEDADALARAMGRLIDSLARAPDEMRERVRSRIVEKFSIDRLVARTETLFERLLACPNGDIDDREEASVSRLMRNRECPEKSHSSRA